MSKFFDTWKKIYGSKIAKASRDFLLGKDMDLSDEEYREKHGYNKPIQTFVPGVTRGMEEAKVLDNITKAIISRSQKPVQTAAINKGLLSTAQAISEPKITAAALKHFNASNAARTWGEFSPAYVDWFKNFRFGSFKQGGVLKGQNGIPESAKIGSYFKGLKDYLFGTTNSFRQSKYSPTKGTDLKNSYYTRDGLKEEVTLNLFGGIDADTKNLLGDQNYFYKDFDDAYTQLTSQSNINSRRHASNGTLGTYAVSAGSDDRGRYISFNDTFDHVIIPGKGIPIYDRIYEDEWKNLYNSNRSALNEGDFFTKSPVLKKLNKSPQQ